MTTDLFRLSGITVNAGRATIAVDRYGATIMLSTVDDAGHAAHVQVMPSDALLMCEHVKRLATPPQSGVTPAEEAYRAALAFRFEGSPFLGDSSAAVQWEDIGEENQRFWQAITAAARHQ